MPTSASIVRNLCVYKGWHTVLMKKVAIESVVTPFTPALKSRGAEDQDLFREGGTRDLAGRHRCISANA